MWIDILTGDRRLPQFHKFGLPEFRVVIDVNLRINAPEFVVRISGPRVNLHLSRVELYEHIVEVPDLLSCLLSLVLEFQGVDDSISDFVGDALQK